MFVYVFHSRLFGTPRIITSSFPIHAALLHEIVNVGEYEKYPEENKWILQDIPLWPKRG